jgi:hypothetical protein
MREVREYEEEKKRRGRGAEGPGIYTSGSGSEVIWRVGALRWITAEDQRILDQASQSAGSLA